MRFSLGFILALSLAGLQFLAIITVVSTSFLSSERAMLEHARDLLAEAGANAGEHSNGFLRPAREASQLSSRLIESGLVAGGDFEALEKLMFQTLLNEAHFAGLYFGDQQGNFVYVNRSAKLGEYRTKFIRIDGSARETLYVWRDAEFAVLRQEIDPADKFDPRDRPWYIRAREAKAAIWTAPYIFFSSQKPGITVASPVSQGGALRGVVGVDIEISTISDFLAQLTIGARGSALILNQNGDVIAHPKLDEINVRDAQGKVSLASIDGIDDPVARAAFADQDVSGVIQVKQETLSEFDYQGETYVSLLKPIEIEDLPWTIAVYAPENDFTQGIKENRRRNIWTAALISLVTALVGVALAEMILKPVRAFAVRTALVSQGEMSAEEPLPRTYKELKRANETLIHEISQRREADAKILDLNRDLSHFSRVNLMGQMATGLAHELSQPLTAISQNVDAAISTARQQNPENTELLGLLEELDEQAHRGGDILRALRGFVRRDLDEKTHFDFAELLQQTDRLLHHEAEAQNIALKFDVPKLPFAFGSRIQIAQILINLIRNAMEAITGANSPVKDVLVSAHSTADGIEVWVEDTGPGIDPNVTLFKQFETSKDDGMGLGLSICRTIAEANNGRLWYDAETKGKTRFCLSLPI